MTAFAWAAMWVLSATAILDAPDSLDQQCPSLLWTERSGTAGFVVPNTVYWGQATFSVNNATFCGISASRCDPGNSVRFEVLDKPSWASANFTPTSANVGNSGPSSSATSRLDVILDASAPKAERFSLRLVGRCQQLSAERTVSLTVAGFVNLTAKLAGTASEDESFTWEVELRNSGTANASIELEVLPADPGGLKMTKWDLPRGIVVAPGAPNRITVAAQDPDPRENYTLVIRPRMMEEPKGGLDDILLPLAIARFGGGQAPGIGTPVFLVALGLLARRLA